MSWNITISNNECPEHPDAMGFWKKGTTYLDYCNVVGKCTYENCPIKDGNVEREKAMELTDD